MQRGRLILILLLILTPVVTIGLVGAWELWHSGWWFWLWWMLPVCWGLGWFLARRWNSFEPMRWPETPSLHWTPQDTAAARIVSQEQERVARLPARELTETGFYVDEVTRLALSLIHI